MASATDLGSANTSSPALVCMGRIGSPYGIKGWVKLISFTQPRDNILSYNSFCTQPESGEQAGSKLEMDQGKPHGKGLIAHFVGYDTPEAARSLTGLELRVLSQILPTLTPGEYYWHQLTGLMVFSKSGVLLGRVDGLLETGANDVLVVEPTEGSVDDRQRLLPWLPEQVVLNVDLADGQMLVDWEPDWLD